MRRLASFFLDGVVIACVLALTTAVLVWLLVAVGFFIGLGALWAIRAAA